MQGQKQFGHVTPTTADFIRYGEVPVSLFTGKMNLEVPIYRIKDTDFDIPISLNYTSDGFKPAKRSGLVGLDWVLNVGGVISREVYGAPDESLPRSGSSSALLGYQLVVNENQYDKDKIWSFDPSVIKTWTDGSAYQYYINSKYQKGSQTYFTDYTPDLFQFNFCGHNGSFMINNQGGVTTNIKGYKVDISGLSVRRPYETLLPDNSTIQLTTPDGYKYVFGGDLSALEFSIAFKQGILPNITSGTYTESTILAWHLSKIIAPNGRSISFYYVNHMLTNFSLNKSDNIWNSTGDNASGIAIKTVTLDSIVTDNIKVEFSKSVEKTFDNTYPTGLFNTKYADYNYASYQLDYIRIVKNKNILYGYSLGYENISKRRFLKTFTLSDNGAYKFAYNHPNSYPQPDEIGITDTWGYWKANNATHSYSLLSKVSYPTGGYSLFAYEPNAYQYRVNTNFSSLTTANDLSKKCLLKTLVTDTVTVGGARIQKVENYSSENVKETAKTYVYRENLSLGSSSGIIYQYPAYYEVKTGGISVVGGWRDNYNIEEPHIGYSTVYEQNSNGSYIKYRFSDYRLNPDVDNSKIVLLSNLSTDEVADACINKLTSASGKNGLLLQKTTSDSLGNTVKNERYLYRNVSPGICTEAEMNMINQPVTDYIVSFRSITGGGLANKIFLQSYPLIYKEETVDAVTQTSTYAYNANDLISSYKELDSHSDTLETIYKYIPDYSTYSTLKNSNYLNYIVDQEQHKNGETINGTSNSYKTSTTYPQLDIVQTYIGPELLNANVTNYNVYDAYGNPVYVVKNSTMKTVYLWGYKGQYLIAKIENATYDDVKNALGGTLPESLSSSDSYSESVISSLRNNTRTLSDALISTYTYQPLVGLLTETNPRGIVTHYSYDRFNRLESISNKDGKFIRSFGYNYQH